MFQFHNGTINTDTLLLIKHTYIQFQFHNGTINTSTKKNEGIIPECRFNSTTVQLILISQSATADEPLFQFHNGTINTLLIIKVMKQRSCFNSTTVQLILSSVTLFVPDSDVSIPQRYN